MKELELQKIIVHGLSVNGYFVKCTTAFRQKGMSGVEKGVADLIVHGPDDPAGVSFSLEVKLPGKIKFSSPEQKLAWLQGETAVVQSVNQALTYLDTWSASRAKFPGSFTRENPVIAAHLYNDAQLKVEIIKAMVQIQNEAQKRKAARLSRRVS